VSRTPRITASSQGESRLRMLRVVRRGNQHDARGLIASVAFEGSFDTAFTEGRSEGLPPGEAVKSLVHACVRRHGTREIEEIGLAVAAEVLARHARVSRVKVEIEETRWLRLEAGGRPQGTAFTAGSGEVRVATVTSNGTQISVIGGLSGLGVMRTTGFAHQPMARDDDMRDGLQPLLVGMLSARWTYTSGDVTFKVFRQGMRAAILDTFAWHQSESVHQALHGVGEVLLATYDDIAQVSLAFRELPYRPADLFAAGTENPDELFVAVDEPVGLVEVSLERGADV
jgi:urate oxidase